MAAKRHKPPDAEALEAPIGARNRFLQDELLLCLFVAKISLLRVRCIVRHFSRL